MMKNLLTILLLVALVPMATSQIIDHDEPRTARDIVHTDDVIITFSACVGNDCVNGENFGFDTQRLKENNLRIHFDDTSNSASFPSRDWRIVINDSSNGGDEYFAIEDATSGRQVFRVDGNSISNALYVNSAGDVGIGTDAPVVEVHAVDGNTPTVRLDQNGSSGFTPQIWDIAGNEANFFVRDVTNSSKLPFKIKPGAPTSSIFVAADGDIGLGTESPDAALHVRRTNSSVDEYLHVEGAGTVFTRLESTDGGSVQIRMKTDVENNRRLVAEDNSGTVQSQIAMRDAGIIDFFATTGSTFTRLTAGMSGLTASSSRSLKDNIVPLEIPDILDRIAKVPVTRYNWKKSLVGEEVSKQEVIGLIAQDFFPVLEHGKNTEINGQDVQMSLWLGVQSLYERDQDLERKLEERDAKILELESKVLEISSKLDEISALIESTRSQSVFLSKGNEALMQNYPNPFLTETTIEYYVPKGSVSPEIQFSDVNGNVLQTLRLQEGPGRINLKVGDLPTGTYLYSLILNRKVISSRKLVVGK